MRAHFLVEAPDEPETLRSFALVINVAYSLAISEDLLVSHADDTFAIPHYQRELESACRSAASVFAAGPSIEETLWHSLKLSAIVIELCSAAPLAIRPCALTLRAQILTLLDECYRDRNIRQ